MSVVYFTLSYYEFDLEAHSDVPKSVLESVYCVKISNRKRIQSVFINIRLPIEKSGSEKIKVLNCTSENLGSQIRQFL